ncbi:MAG TPA: DUF4214 domain-containing protein [Gemmataceae bacterium]|nr:DUF4214 domain-containing protein [Gemmataceae bacterium]
MTRRLRKSRSCPLMVEALEPRYVLDLSQEQVFVGLAYQALLNRPVDTSGLAFFSTMLDNGSADRMQVSLTIQNSNEYRTDYVESLYGEFLHRPADPTGLAYFKGLLASGDTYEQVQSLIFGSAEYFQDRGGGTNDGFLDALYNDVLYRTVDPAGRTGFDQELANSVSTTQVAATVLASPEYAQDLVGRLYEYFLHRPVDPSGLSLFTSALGQGATDQQVIAAIMGSGEFAAGAQPPQAAGNLNLIVNPLDGVDQVGQLIDRAAAASSSNDAIIAVVDRGGRLLGVRVESGVSSTITSNPALLTFAVDGAIAEARTAAMFANQNTPLTSRTIEFISQTTMTQREVESSPDVTDVNSPLYGPGFVAPVSIAGHFPPGVQYTPQVDLFDIEASNRDSYLHPGANGILSPTNVIQLPNRFNVGDANIPLPDASKIQPTESYGQISGIDPYATSRGIGTLPGGVPIMEMDSSGNFQVVGGIGVFFPGTTGYATAENSSLSATYNPALPDLSVVAEYMAFAAVGGSVQGGAPVGTLAGVPPVAGIGLPFGGITLNGISLPLFGPGPAGPLGLSALVQVGRTLGTGNPSSGTNLPVDLAGDTDLPGTTVPDGWLVTPHAGGGLTAADVIQMVQQGIAQAQQTRSAIRLPQNQTAEMVFSVSDNSGNILGLYRMPDATTFSLDVAVAKSRNVAYYANPAQLQPIDQTPGVAPGVAFSSRTFRYLALPFFPEGIGTAPPGPFSILTDGGTSLQTALNVGAPLPASAFKSVQGHDVFFPETNFHDPYNIANQNGVILFPGGVPLYKNVNGQTVLVGGLGVSGDGVDEDDLITYAASQGFLPPSSVHTADQETVNGVQLPYQKFDRNPEG